MLRIIQVGVGGRGNAFRITLRERDDIKIVAAVDIVEKPLKDAAAEFSLPDSALYTDFNKAIAENDADAALIVTPPFNHRQIAEAAYARGMDVLTEKPLASTMEDCRAIVAGAKKAGRTLMVTQNYRFRPSPRMVKRLIQNGAVGRLSHVFCAFRLHPDWGPYRKAMEHPMLVEMAIHHFDMARSMLGRDPKSIFCHTWNTPWSWFKGDPAVAAVIQYEDGLPLIYEANSTSFGSQTGWFGQWRFEGEKGAIHLNDHDISIVRDGAAPEPLDPDMDLRPRSGGDSRVSEIHTIWDAFLAARQNRSEPECSGADNLKSIALVFAAIDSAREGRPSLVADYLKG